MDMRTYELAFREAAIKAKKDEDYISKWLNYAKNLNDQDLPVIYSQLHLCNLLGYKPEYVYGAANSADRFYRCFTIPKKNGKLRKISEPLPSLKEIQRWILDNILVEIKTSPYAKAYVLGLSVRDNAKFHRKQKKVLSLDIKDFYDSLKNWYVFKVFLDAGYAKDVSKMLSQLCCLNDCLPQGAPTSSALSNIIMKNFDIKIGTYCKENSIRYTRYADDMTFSGDFDECKVISLVKKELAPLNLRLNADKTRVRKQGQQQEVTGIVVNSKMQASKDYRKKIRQEIYYIKKFGLQSHMEKTGQTQAHYLEHLLGQINYASFINPADKEMAAYRDFIREMMKNR